MNEETSTVQGDTSTVHGDDDEDEEEDDKDEGEKGEPIKNQKTSTKLGFWESLFTCATVSDSSQTSGQASTLT